MTGLDYEEVRKRICDFIIGKTEGLDGAVIGISGGVDSAVVAQLAVEALGRDNVIGLLMPYGAQKDIAHSLMVVERLGIPHVTVDIRPLAETFAGTGCFGSDMAKANLRARARMLLLYGVANSKGMLVLGTGNKSEIEVGYYTKYGDGGVDILPIGDLYKTEVWGLARHIGVPKEIVEKAPSAGLWEGQTDEGEMGVKYNDLDAILQGGGDGCDAKLREHVAFMRKRSEHKRSLPPIAKVR